MLSAVWFFPCFRCDRCFFRALESIAESLEGSKGYSAANAALCTATVSAQTWNQLKPGSHFIWVNLGYCQRVPQAVKAVLRAGSKTTFGIWDYFTPCHTYSCLQLCLRGRQITALELENLLESSWLPSSSGAVWKMRHVRGHACSFLPAGHTCCSRLFTPCSTKYQGLLTQVWLAFHQRRARLVLFVFKLEEKSFLELLPLTYFTW